MDTSEQAMKAQGLPSVKDEVKLRPILKSSTLPRGSTLGRATSPQQQKKTTFTINKVGSDGAEENNQQGNSSTSNRINIIKEE